MNSNTLTQEQIDDADRAFAEFREHEAKQGVDPVAAKEFWHRWRMWGLAVNKLGKHSYEGTVPQKTIDKRRAANKVAKASRRANR